MRPARSRPASQRLLLELSRARYSYYFLSDVLRGQNKIDTAACNRALEHIGGPGRIKFLRDGNAPHLLYAALRRRRP